MNPVLSDPRHSNGGGLLSTPLYSERFQNALEWTAVAFRNVRRKGSNVPYLTHLLQVCVWVGENGGDEDQLIAALLHDALEDIEGTTPSWLAEQYGQRVADLVVALSDCESRPKPPWAERKLTYIAHLGDAHDDVKLISCADKLHNASSILRDHARIGDAIWDRFTPPVAGTLWYYRQVTHALSTNWQSSLLDELCRTVAALHRCAGFDVDSPPPFDPHSGG